MTRASCEGQRGKQQRPEDAGRGHVVTSWSAGSTPGQILAVPGEHALEPVTPIARCVKFVVLPRINHELGLPAKTLECLIHLLRVDQRDVEVELPADEHRRRDDPVGMEERV